jgi:protein SCO1/2
VPRLKQYARKLGVSADRWHFVTGEKEEIYGIAEDYFSVATEDPDAPGGYDHSGRLILVDPKGHVRSFCDGTDPEAVDEFIDDIEKLLHEMETQ